MGRALGFASALLAIGLSICGHASAQATAQPGAQPAPPAGAPPATAQPTAPPPGSPPPGYGYPPPYPYQYPPPRPVEAPRTMAYDESKGIPPGYRLEEKIRPGLVISGAIVLGVPYIIGINVAAAADFDNHSYWLVVPGIGPFLTLATRDDSCDKNSTAGEGLDCLGDAIIRFYLVLDGIMQMTGGTLFLLGITMTKQVLVRQDVTLQVGPRSFGKSGYGLGVVGTF